LRLLEEYKPGRKIQTNVEFYTALLLHGLELPTDLFTPTFAVGRVAGWVAHCFEQQKQNRLIRPDSEYIGEKGRHWVTVRNDSSKLAVPFSLGTETAKTLRVIATIMP
jgi:citrate synthase